MHFGNICDIIGIRNGYVMEGIHMELREELIELRKSTGMNKKQFSEYFGIPYRTYQDWELGNRRVPEYLLRLMAYKIEMEKRYGET